MLRRIYNYSTKYHIFLKKYIKKNIFTDVAPVVVSSKKNTTRYYIPIYVMILFTTWIYLQNYVGNIQTFVFSFLFHQAYINHDLLRMMLNFENHLQCYLLNVVYD